jgi:hypothetical protein
MNEREESLMDGWEDQYEYSSLKWSIRQVNGTLSARVLLESERLQIGTDTAIVTFPVSEMEEQPPNENTHLLLGPKNGLGIKYKVVEAEYIDGPIAKLTLDKIR